MSIVKSTILLAYLLLASGAAFGQNPLTLEQAKAIALERNLDVVQAMNNVESAQSSVLAATGNYLPTLSASGGWSHDRSSARYLNGVEIPSGTSGVTESDYYRTGVDLNYTIFDGFAREATHGRATSNAVAAEQRSDRTRQSVAFQVETQYLNVLRLEQLVTVSEENLKRDRRQLERITESNKVGALSLADVYRQQSQVAADELNLINAQNDFNKAKADLASLIGLDMTEEHTFADPAIQPTISKEELDGALTQYDSFASVSGRALAARPDFIGARENLSAAESGVTIAKSGYWPSVAASAGYGLANNKFSRLTDNNDISVGINLRWNIFDGFATNERIQTAAAARRNAEVSVVQLQRDINVEVKKALLDLDAARKQYEVSQKGLVSATEDRKIAEERYNLGAGTLLDLLTANANLVNAQANGVNASYNFLLSKKRVEYTIGEHAY